MKWLTYIIPRIVLKTGSGYNRDIRVLMESGKYKLLVNGARESGVWVKGLWQVALRSFQIKTDPRVKNILVFGIAGGTVIHMLSELYPAANIIGVDIDAVMIGVGKSYFGLSAIPHLTCVCRDAVSFAEKYKGRAFDMVVLDVYIGPDVPDFVLSAGFQIKVHHMINKGGKLIINYLRRPGYESRAVALRKVLRSLYSRVISTDMQSNRFFLANSL